RHLPAVVERERARGRVAAGAEAGIGEVLRGGARGARHDAQAHRQNQARRSHALEALHYPEARSARRPSGANGDGPVLASTYRSDARMPTILATTKGRILLPARRHVAST